MVTYAIEALVNAGITELMLVTGGTHAGEFFRLLGDGHAYGIDTQVWDVVASLEPSARGELEITDVNNWYVGRGDMAADVVEGFWGDAGESIDAYYAVNDHVRQNGANRS